MANFQESRFLGLSPRAVWLTLAIAGVVVGLFFVPPALKLLVDSSGKPKQRSAAAVAPPVRPEAEQKAAMSPEKLQQVSSSISPPAVEQKQAQKPQPSKKGDTNDSSGGFFSGWDFKVKARGAGDGGGVPAPPGLSIERIGTKEAQAFFKGGVADIKRFIKRERIPPGPQADSMMTFASAIGELASGVKGISAEEIVGRLAALHAQTLRDLSAAGADRGALMTWLSLPVVSFVDAETGVHATAKIRQLFIPRMVLLSASIVERAPPVYGLGQGAMASARLQFAVRSSDVQSIRVINNGELVKDLKLGHPNAQGDRVVRLNGDATGVWTFVAFDKFGGRPYSRSYAFYPKVMGFPQDPSGLYEIDFVPGSAPNAIDKFFFVGSSEGRRTSDPIISRF